MSGRRDPLTELERLVRVPEPGTHNIAGHLSEHEDVIVSVLGLGPADFAVAEQLPDELLAPQLEPRLLQLRRDRLGKRLRAAHQRSLRAATGLGQSARWTPAGAVLDPTIVLGELLADRTARLVSFDLPDGSSVPVSRSTLVSLARITDHLPKISVSVDANALRFRWRGQKGGLNLSARTIPAHDEHVLHVVLSEARKPEPIPRTLPELRPLPKQSPDRPRAGAWLADVLGELGWP
jgi:hypothetical protein